METKAGIKNRQLVIIFYFIILVLAIMLRFLKLGALPLGDSEAVNALQAMKVAKGQAATIGGQPGYVALTSIVFFIFKSSEFWARFWPALFGVAVVLLPLLFRKWLGERTALILAFFLAIEPGFTALSRNATGTMIGVVCLVAALGFYLNRQPIPAGISAGLALLSGTAFWPGLIAICLTFLIYKAASKRWPELSIKNEEEELSPFAWKPFVFAFGGTVLLLGTVFLLKPAVISGLGSSIAGYFRSWSTSGTSIKVMLISLLCEQLLAVLLALWGSIAGRRKHAGLNFLLGTWALLAILFVLANPSSQVVDWIWTLVPLWTLAALGLEDLLVYFTKGEWLLKLFQTIMTFSLLIFAYLNLLSIVIGSSNGEKIFSPVLSILLPIFLLIIVTFLIGWGWSVEASRQGLLLGIGLLLIGCTFGSGWKAAGLGSRPELELWRMDELPTGRDLLIKQVNELSIWNGGEPEYLDVVLLNVNSPSLEWALRNFTLQEADIVTANETPSLAVTQITDTASLAQIYRGQQFTWTSEPPFDQFTTADWVRWFAFRDCTTNEASYLLWARSDLFKGS